MLDRIIDEAAPRYRGPLPKPADCSPCRRRSPRRWPGTRSHISQTFPMSTRSRR